MNVYRTRPPHNVIHLVKCTLECCSPARPPTSTLHTTLRHSGGHQHIFDCMHIDVQIAASASAAAAADTTSAASTAAAAAALAVAAVIAATQYELLRLTQQRRCGRRCRRRAAAAGH